MDDCLFCKIANGTIPSQKVYESDNILMFRDIDPQAPTHFLAIPKTHIASLDKINAENSGIIAEIFEKIPTVCAELGIKNGYRVVSNCGIDGGQTVGHIHFHILGGRSLAWPPG